MDKRNPYAAPHFAADPEPTPRPGGRDKHLLLLLAQAFSNARSTALMIIVAGVGLLIYIPLMATVAKADNSMARDVPWLMTAEGQFFVALIVGGYLGAASLLQLLGVNSVTNAFRHDRSDGKSAHKPSLFKALIPVVGLIELIKAGNLAAARLKAHHVNVGRLRVPASEYHELAALIAVTPIEEDPKP